MKKAPKTKKVPKPLSERDRRICSVHECGHAIVLAVTGQKVKLVSVEQIPGGDGSLGRTSMICNDDQIKTREEYLDAICFRLAGQCAEEFVLGITTNTAGNDTRFINVILKYMLYECGMSLFFPNQTFNPSDIPISETSLQVLECEERSIIEKCRLRTMQILAMNETLLLEMSDYLFRHGKLTGVPLTDFLKRVRPPSMRIKTHDA